MIKTGTKAKALPPIPEPHPTLVISVTLTLDHDFERFSNGYMRMTLERSEVANDAGEIVGHVASVIPNGVVVKVGSRSYYLAPMDLWNAVEAAEVGATQVG